MPARARRQPSPAGADVPVRASVGGRVVAGVPVAGFTSPVGVAVGAGVAVGPGRGRCRGRGRLGRAGLDREVDRAGHGLALEADDGLVGPGLERIGPVLGDDELALTGVDHELATVRRGEATDDDRA